MKIEHRYLNLLQIIWILAPFLISSVSPAFGSLRDISPRPQQMGVISESPMAITGSFYMVVPDNPTDVETRVQQEVIRLFQESSLRTPISVEYSQFTFDIPSIWIGTADRFPALVEAMDSTRISEMGAITHSEEYQIFVDESRILILGEDHRALRWGALSLLKLIGDVNGTLYIDRVYIRDWPDYGERIATVNCPMRTESQYTYATDIADSAYLYKMNEIEWNESELGRAPEDLTPWTAAFFFPHAVEFKQMLSDRGQKLSVSVDRTAKTVDDYSWQEAIPITNTKMRVTSSGFVVDPDGYNIQLGNADFESWSGSQPTSWEAYRDYLWSHFSRDTSIRHSGQSSLKIQTAGSDLQLRQWISVQPYGYYNVRFWIKTSGFSGSFYLDAHGPSPVENKVIRITSAHLDIASTQDWTEYVVPFSSYHLDEVKFMIGLYSLASGTFWLDDVQIETADLERVVRRPDTPLNVYEEPGHILRTEGVDYRVVETYSTAFNNYMLYPRLERIPGGALYLNDIVSVDWGCAVYFQMARNTVCFSLLEPLQRYQDKIRVADSLVSPDGFKIHINEVSYAGHDQLCQSRGLTPAQLVGRYCNSMYEIIQARRPGAPVRIYGDPFDYYAYDPRAMPSATPNWTTGENGQGTLAQISNNIVISAMGMSSSDIDSSLMNLDHLGFSSLMALMADKPASDMLYPALVARKYDSCRGVLVFGWWGVQSNTKLVSQLAWNTGPYILHTPAVPATASDSVTVNAEIWSDALGQSANAEITSAVLRYRWLPSGNWIESQLQPHATNLYSSTIPPGGSLTEGLEYSIIAEDARDQVRRAPAGENESFVVQLSSSTPEGLDRTYIEIEHTIMVIGDFTLVEWTPVTDAEYYEVHYGPKPDFKAEPKTKIARQNRKTPRYLVPNTDACRSSGIAVYAVIHKGKETSKRTNILEVTKRTKD